jgi:hypothetical protein
MAEWMLFYIERAIWLQFKANVEQQESGKGSFNRTAASV